MDHFYPRKPAKAILCIRVFLVFLTVFFAQDLLAQAPVITAFVPREVSGPGSTVRIYGTNLAGATVVSFGGIPAVSFTGDNDSIIAILGKGATGHVAVTTPSGSDTAGGLFIVDDREAAIASFSPSSGGTGTVITIKGNNFAPTTSVTIGGVAAASYSNVDSTIIYVTVGNGASGDVIVNTRYAGSDTAHGFTFLTTPVINSFSPDSAGSGTVVTLKGHYLTGTTAVSFGGVPAKSFTQVDSATVTAVVGTGATGVIVLSTGKGVDTVGGFTFIPPPPPTISTFTPTSAAADSTVVITGTNFTGATSVDFGGTPAASFTVISPTTINAVVGSGTTGWLSVVANGDTARLDGFAFIPPLAPNIQSYTPTTATSDSVVTIYGTSFTGVTAVSFGNVPAASFTVVSSNEIKAVVGAGASGYIHMVNAIGPDSIGGFTFIPPPTPFISSFTPIAGATGTIVTIKGSNLTGATAVSFGGTPAASFTVVDSNTVKAIVDSGATGDIRIVTPLGSYTTGNMVVQSPEGPITITGFTYDPPPVIPVINSFTPTSGATDSTVIITGTNFTGASEVKFGGTDAASFTVVSATTIKAVVGTGSTGPVSVIAGGETGSFGTFTYVPPPAPPVIPTISSFTPTSAATDSTVIITGTNFANITNVNFGAYHAASFTVVSPTTISAVVGLGASGSVSVLTATDTAYLGGFTFIQPTPPTIVSFSPTSATQDSTVTITGTNFIGVTGVSFGTIPAASLTVVSPTMIRAVVGSGASGNVVVSALYGTATAAGFTYTGTPAVPVINSFTPDSAEHDSIVYIYGLNFTGASEVSFGGTPAASFTVVNGGEIEAVVDSGSSGSVSVRGPGGTGSRGGFTYLAAPPPPAVPTIISFTPTSAATDSVVVITGTNFTAATAVAFGGSPAASFTILSPTVIRAVVGNGLSGAVSVTNAVNTGFLAGFTYIAPDTPPTIASFSPTSAGLNAHVVITGTNFVNVTSVSLGGVQAGFSTVSATEVDVTVGYVASGSVVVTTLSGTATLDGFTYTGPPAPVYPTIASFSPTSAAKDSTVIITGTNLTGATQVTFGGTPAISFAVLSGTKISAVVGAGASGEVVVITPDDTVALAGFTFVNSTPPPPPPPPSTPFSLSSFNGSVVTNEALLQWQAVNDKSISSYVIQSNTDSSLNFTTVGTQASKASDSSSYSFLDASPHGGNNYYHLEITDTLGQVTFSPVVVVKLPGGTNQLASYPNPAKGTVTVTYPLLTGNATLNLFDTQGHLVKSVPLSAGTNRASMDVSGVPTGIYMMQLKGAGQSMHYSIMVE